jgi:hypothetical protein
VIIQCIERIARCGLFGACFVEAGKDPFAQLKARKAAAAQA